MSSEPTSRAGWHGARREIAVAACGIAVLAIGTSLGIGLAAGSVVVLGGVAVMLVAARVLIGPYHRAEPPPEVRADTPTTSFVGYWRTQTDLTDAMKSMGAWDLTRQRLQRLLAARLAERHGVSLAADPQAAREIFTGTSPGRAAELWYWIDPARPTPPDAGSRPGIPPRVLAALIQRLEQL